MKTHPIVAQLATIRHRQRTSQESAARRAGLHRRTVLQIENGQRGAYLDTVTRYAFALGYRLELVPIQNGANTQ